MPAADIEKMSDAELERALMPYFPHTRPAGALPSALAVGVNKQEETASDPFIAKRMAALAAKRSAAK